MKNAFTAALLVLLLGAVVALFQLSANGRYTFHHADPAGNEYLLDTRTGLMFELSSGGKAVAEVNLKIGSVKLLPVVVDSTRMPFPAKAGAVNP